MTYAVVPDTYRGHYNLASPCRPVVLIDLSLFVVDTCVVMSRLYSPFLPEFLCYFLGLGSRQRIDDASATWVMCLDESRDVLQKVFLHSWFLTD